MNLTRTTMNTDVSTKVELANDTKRTLERRETDIAYATRNIKALREGGMSVKSHDGWVNLYPQDEVHVKEYLISMLEKRIEKLKIEIAILTQKLKDMFV